MGIWFIVFHFIMMYFLGHIPEDTFVIRLEFKESELNEKETESVKRKKESLGSM